MYSYPHHHLKDMQGFRMENHEMAAEILTDALHKISWIQHKKCKSMNKYYGGHCSYTRECYHVMDKGGIL